MFEKVLFVPVRLQGVQRIFLINFSCFNVWVSFGVQGSAGPSSGFGLRSTGAHVSRVVGFGVIMGGGGLHPPAVKSKVRNSSVRIKY